jgi:CDP-diacylglycerol--serine O-phosphatidyltransferase
MRFPPGQLTSLVFQGGLAPAAIAFAAGVNSRLDQVILLYFTGCGVSRLARYNVTAESLSAETGKVTYFEGTPIPTAVVPLAALMLAFYRGNLYRVELLGVAFHAIALLFLVSGSLMISKTLRIPKP